MSGYRDLASLGVDELDFLFREATFEAAQRAHREGLTVTGSLSDTTIGQLLPDGTIVPIRSN